VNTSEKGLLKSSSAQRKGFSVLCRFYCFSYPGRDQATFETMKKQTDPMEKKHASIWK